MATAKAQKPAARVPGKDTSSVRVRVFDGTRQLLTVPGQLLIRVIGADFKERFSREGKASDLTVTGLPFFDNFGDNYSILASHPQYVGAGFAPVTLSPDRTEGVDLLLLPRKASLNLEPWGPLAVNYPKFAAIIGAQSTDAPQRYEALRTDAVGPDSNLVIADLLNILTAIRDIELPAGTPLDYLKALRWDGEFAPKRDRFFAWADPELLNQVKLAAAQKHFDQELNPQVFHAGATSSYKENHFGEANVQFTFHENDRLMIGGTNCVLVEPDIDYYRDMGAHGILEVIPGLFPNHLTDPRTVFALRWMATKRAAGVPAFEPPYTIDLA